jgi:hypothetical protein
MERNLGLAYPTAELVFLFGIQNTILLQSENKERVTIFREFKKPNLLPGSYNICD